MANDDKFVDGKDFNEWFEKNHDIIHQLMRNDPHELLYAAWFAGYGNGMDYMGGLYPKLFGENNAT